MDLKGIKKVLYPLFLSIAFIACLGHAEGQDDHVSPNGKYLASISRQDSTGDIKVEIRSHSGNRLFSVAYRPDDPEHEYSLVQAEWTPDSQYFIYSLNSKDGHMQWHYPTAFIDVWDFREYYLDDLLGPIAKGHFVISPPDIIRTAVRDPGNTPSEVEISLRELVARKNGK